MDTDFFKILGEKKSSISKRWLDAMIATYPNDNSGFLMNQKDRFANPVGYTFSTGIDGILEVLVKGEDFSESLSFLEDIIKVRAIQDFTPAKAMAFIFQLKTIVREELIKELRQNQIYVELLEFESKIDDLALTAFDIYVKCREQIYELRTDELKRMTFTLLKKANLMSEIPVQESEQNDQK
ncbi:MAG: RsbRD N-terminal domain-containing protein [Ignavibacteriales bacterium]